MEMEKATEVSPLLDKCRSSLLLKKINSDIAKDMRRNDKYCLAACRYSRTSPQRYWKLPNIMIKQYSDAVRTFLSVFAFISILEKQG